ncbi:ABC transporter [Rhodanobacter sp. Root561]|uniref:ABC transporter permease n=1 Tax=Rhodanobacter sp. Root561 TaxID=1736560 RepID=UPI0006FD6A79|nr:ABC transporter permease [Rhodanobacter sp. Root561]KQZ79962.1 ABC transporter [Rhodanobacter sp. Root561]
MFRYYLDLAWRRCWQGPAMVLLLVLTMAIGIASCMTALTIFGALSGEPLPGISPYLHVVTMDAREAVDANNNDYDKPDGYLKLTDAKALVDAQRARQQVALAQSYTLVGRPDGKQSDQVQGLMAHGPVLAMFGVPLRHGRSWTAEEQAAQAPVVVIDSALAQKLFGTEDAVGRSVSLGSGSFRVVGVSAPWKPRTQFLDVPRNQGNVLGQPEQFFVPAQAALAAGVGPLTAGECGKGAAVVSFQSAEVDKCRWLEVWVALDTPATVAAYARFVAGYADAQHAAGRFVYPPQAALYGVPSWMSMNHVVPDDVGLNLALAGAFLLLCLVNVAGLLAARFLRRQADVTIRRALGASRRNVFAQHLVETGVLGLIGGALALPLTWLGLWIVRMQPVAYADAAHFSVSAFAALLLLSLVVGLVVGILPAWRVCRQPPAMQIKLG